MPTLLPQLAHTEMPTLLPQLAYTEMPTLLPQLAHTEMLTLPNIHIILHVSSDTRYVGVIMYRVPLQIYKGINHNSFVRMHTEHWVEIGNSKLWLRFL